MEYIGQTSGSSNLHINGHRSAIKNCTSSRTSHTCNADYAHFKKHGLNNMTITILNMETNTMNIYFLEYTHTKHFNTLYTYGLNQKLKNKLHRVYSKLSHALSYNTFYPSLFHNLYKESTRTERENSANSQKFNNTHQTILKKTTLIFLQEL